MTSSMGLGGGAAADTGGRAARNAVVLAAATLTARLSMFALGVVLARALGVDAYGSFGLAVAIGTVLVPLADLGFTPYLVREVARSPGSAAALARTLLRAKLGWTLALTALLCAGAFVAISDPDVRLPVIVVAASLLIDGVSQLIFAYFQGRESMGYEARLTAATALARSFGAAAIAVATHDLVPVVAWWILVSVVQLALAGRRLTADRGTAERSSTPRVDRRAVASMGAMTLFVMVYLRIDAVVIAAFFDEGAVGLYTAATTVMLGLQVLPWMATTALVPVFARAHATDPELFQRTWREGLRLVLLIALPFALACSLLATPLIVFAFGDTFREAGTPLAVLVWASPLGAMSLIANAAVRGAGRERWLLAVSGIGAAANVIANLIVVPRHGIDGAAAVTVATEAFVAVAVIGLALRGRVLGRPRLPVVRIAVPLAALAAAALVSDGLPVVVRGLLAMAAFGATALATRALGPAEVALLRSGLRRRAGGG